LRRVRARPDASAAKRALAEKIAEATKGLPPEEQLAIGKRMIDQALK
jgi:hypothetical protein